MKNIKFILLLALTGFFSTGAHAAKVVMLEEALESNSLDIRVTNDLSGIVKGRRCDSCEIEIVTITPATRLQINGADAELLKAKQRSGKPGTALYNIKTREVRLIKSYD